MMNDGQKKLSPLFIPWYKTRGGVVFLIIISAVVLFFVAFLGLVGFYTWQIKYRDQGTTLTKQFQTEKFTVARTQKNVPTVPVQPKLLIHSGTPTLDVEKAPITIIAFIDFECPFCRQSYPIFEQVVATYEPVVRVVFKQFPILDLHPNSLSSANAAACAEAQGKFWPYYRSLFGTQQLSHVDLINQAKDTGLDVASFTGCLDRNTYQSDIDKDIADGLSLGVRGTPTYFVNDTKIEGVIDRATWDTILLEKIRSTKSEIRNKSK